MPRPKSISSRAVATGTGRSRGLVTRQHRDANGGLLAEVGHERRASVYRTDVPFAPPDQERVPRRGTPERAELARWAAELRATGKTYVDIGVELHVSHASARTLIIEHLATQDGRG